MAAKISLPHKDIVVKWKEEKIIKWLKRVSYFSTYDDALYIYLQMYAKQVFILFFFIL